MRCAHTLYAETHVVYTTKIAPKLMTLHNSLTFCNFLNKCLIFTFGWNKNHENRLGRTSKPHVIIIIHTIILILFTNRN